MGILYDTGSPIVARWSLEIVLKLSDSFLLTSKPCAATCVTEAVNSNVESNNKFCCSKCEFASTSTSMLEQHIQTIHNSIRIRLSSNDKKVLSCELCDYKCILNIQLKKHQTKFHTSVTKSTSAGDDTVALHRNLEVSKDLKKLRKSTEESIKNLENSIKNYIDSIMTKSESQFKQLNNSVKNLNTRIDIVGKSFDMVKVTKEIDKLDNTMKKIKRKKKNKKKTFAHNSTIQTVSEFETSDECPQSSLASNVQSGASNVQSSGHESHTASNPVQANEQPVLTPFLRQPKILFVKDSVADVANLRKAEAVTRTRIRSARAVTSVSLDNSVESNLEQVVKHHLANPGREAYKFLIMSAPSNDITTDNNMNTSCNNLIKIAEKALVSNKYLKKVIILKHAPRFDNVKNKKLKLKRPISFSLNCWGILN